MASKSRTAADRQRAAGVRDWAKAQGIDVAPQGRIPATVLAQYDAATSGDSDGPGPDWDTAVDALDLDAADLESEPPGVAPLTPGADAAGGPGGALPPPGEPAPPPPASLDEARERLSGRPGRVPPWAGSGGGRADQRPAPPPVKITPALLKDIEGKLALMLAIPVTLWETADPACGGAAAANLDTAIHKAVPLIAQSPEAIAFFTSTGKWLLWLDLLVALRPVGESVWAHHVAGTVTVVNGRPVPARRLADGRVVPADHVTPAPQQDWSAYGTDFAGHVPPPRAPLDPAEQAASIRRAAAERRAAGQ